VTDENGEQFVAYYLPTSETLKKLKRDGNDDEIDCDENEKLVQ